MKKQTVHNQEVNGDEGFIEGEGYPSCEGTPCDNVTEGEDGSTATMSERADEKSEEAPANDFEKEAAEWRDKYIRLQAEFDNFRKRTLREKMDLVQSGGADVLKTMLSVLDDVYRAVEASEKSEDIEALREGEKLVAQKFCDALRSKGVTEIEAKDKEFDSDLHEAVARFAAGEDKRGKVIDVVQRGYMLGEKVLRYAKVVVGE
ncbi:MAG: nucleotide exchange factor GrpE [Alistipes sp.]|nr:nucleotide exchange factor GrpE [Alistipes sp.]